MSHLNSRVRAHIFSDGFNYECDMKVCFMITFSFPLFTELLDQKDSYICMDKDVYEQKRKDRALVWDEVGQEIVMVDEVGPLEIKLIRSMILVSWTLLIKLIEWIYNNDLSLLSL